MCRAVTPRTSLLEAWLLTGNSDKDGCAWGAVELVHEHVVSVALEMVVEEEVDDVT